MVTDSETTNNGIQGFPKRLLELIGTESKLSFGRNVGITDSGLRKYLPPGKSLPTFEKLVAIARYKGVQLEWLATGQGPKEISQGEFICIPCISSQLPNHDTPWKSITSQGKYPLAAHELSAIQCDDPKQLLAINTEHDSTLISVVIDMGYTSLIDGYTYAIRAGDEICVRVIQKHSDGKIQMAGLSSFSTPDIAASENSIDVLGRVVLKTVR
ncbi:hypothetical protein KCG43_20260 [Photobacterium sp. WH24]|uniref:S24 family peptidase n=1 Tax=Photobacterium sp. WH24 TaxID=2827237 RepID=UPI001C4469A4|nr:hypothetical protein [Photobacterium sp. WH24]MBV7264349.1 hypothetical protein [Photobacterium sp. WH24]